MNAISSNGIVTKWTIHETLEEKRENNGLKLKMANINNIEVREKKGIQPVQK